MVGFLTSNYSLSYSDQLQVSTGLNSPACSTGSAFLKVTNNLYVAKSESILGLHPNQLLNKLWLLDCYFSLKLFLLLIIEHLCFSLCSHLSGFFFFLAFMTGSQIAGSTRSLLNAYSPPPLGLLWPYIFPPVSPLSPFTIFLFLWLQLAWRTYVFIENKMTTHWHIQFLILKLLEGFAEALGMFSSLQETYTFDCHSTTSPYSSQWGRPRDFLCFS